MTEAEITFQISEYLNRVWEMQQWWASISLGVLVMAHMASERLNLLIVTISLALYTSYTLYMNQMAGENYDTIFALAADLQKLIDLGVVNSHSAKEVASLSATDATLYLVTMGGTYISVVSYLIYSYMRARRAESA